MSIKKGYGSDLTDTQWEQLKKIFTKSKIWRSTKRG